MSLTSYNQIKFGSPLSGSDQSTINKYSDSIMLTKYISLLAPNSTNYFRIVYDIKTNSGYNATVNDTILAYGISPIVSKLCECNTSGEKIIIGTPYSSSFVTLFNKNFYTESSQITSSIATPTNTNFFRRYELISGETALNSIVDSGFKFSFSTILGADIIFIPDNYSYFVKAQIRADSGTKFFPALPQINQIQCKQIPSSSTTKKITESTPNKFKSGLISSQGVLWALPYNEKFLCRISSTNYIAYDIDNAKYKPTGSTTDVLKKDINGKFIDCLEINVASNLKMLIGIPHNYDTILLTEITQSSGSTFIDPGLKSDGTRSNTTEFLPIPNFVSDKNVTTPIIPNKNLFSGYHVIGNKDLTQDSGIVRIICIPHSAPSLLEIVIRSPTSANYQSKTTDSTNILWVSKFKIKTRWITTFSLYDYVSKLEVDQGNIHLFNRNEKMFSSIVRDGDLLQSPYITVPYSYPVILIMFFDEVTEAWDINIDNVNINNVQGAYCSGVKLQNGVAFIPEYENTLTKFVDCEGDPDTCFYDSCVSTDFSNPVCRTYVLNKLRDDPNAITTQGLRSDVVKYLKKVGWNDGDAGLASSIFNDPGIFNQLKNGGNTLNFKDALMDSCNLDYEEGNERFKGMVNSKCKIFVNNNLGGQNTYRDQYINWCGKNYDYVDNYDDKALVQTCGCYNGDQFNVIRDLFETRCGGNSLCNELANSLKPTCFDKDCIAAVGPNGTIDDMMVNIARNGKAQDCPDTFIQNCILDLTNVLVEGDANLCVQCIKKVDSSTFTNTTSTDPDCAKPIVDDGGGGGGGDGGGGGGGGDGGGGGGGGDGGGGGGDGGGGGGGGDGGGDFISNIITKIKNFITSIGGDAVITKIKDFITKIGGDAVITKIKDFITKIGGDAVITKVKDFINGIIAKIKDLTSGSGIGSIVDKVKDFINGIIAKIKDLTSGSGIGSIVDKVKDFINGIIAKIKDLTSGIGG